MQRSMLNTAVDQPFLPPTYLVKTTYIQVCTRFTCIYGCYSVDMVALSRTCENLSLLTGVSIHLPQRLGVCAVAIEGFVNLY